MQCAAATAGLTAHPAQRQSPAAQQHAALKTAAAGVSRSSAAQQQRCQHPRSRSSRPASRAAAAATAAPTAALAAEDKWIERSLAAVVPASDAFPQQLAALQSTCLSALSTMRMPTSRNEEYRFTDISPLLKHSLAPASSAGASSAGAAELADACAARGLKQATAATVVVVDGVIDQQHSSMGDLPAGVYVGGLAGAPQDVVPFALGGQSRSRGGPFATLNGAAAQDVLVVHVAANTTVTAPIHIVYLASSATAAAAAGGLAPASAPRLLAVLEEGAVAEIIEEFGAVAAALPGTAAPAAAAGAAAATQAVTYLTNAVAEIELDDCSALKHSYVQLESTGAAHMKSTLVNQGRESSYSLVEAHIGGALSRHDVNVEQLGAATQTSMRSFLLCGKQQVHDLHSKLKLDHPNGEASQLHKCIVSAATGRGVFDGNVRVNRLAQKTDAKQLSRNLLLVPRATVNVKPNLQIVADDVKCTHGCTVSDLEEEELFYLRARGITAEVARTLLVYSFGGEVVQGLRDEALQGRVEAAVRAELTTFAPNPLPPIEVGAAA